MQQKTRPRVILMALGFATAIVALCVFIGTTKTPEDASPQTPLTAQTVQVVSPTISSTDISNTYGQSDQTSSTPLTNGYTAEGEAQLRMLGFDPGQRYGMKMTKRGGGAVASFSGQAVHAQQ